MKQIESDFYGRQKQAWHLICYLRVKMRKCIAIAKISSEEWSVYFAELFKANIVDKQGAQARETDETCKMLKRRNICTEEIQ